MMYQFTVSDEKSKLDLKLIHQFLTNSYWAEGRTLEQVKKSVQNSVSYGIYQKKKQIGFARVVTDFVTIAYLMDVFIIEDYRGKGLSKVLLKKVLEDDRFINVKKWMLATLDAQNLYKKFGFNHLKSPEKLMEKLL